jgi:hypothetical protein
MTTRPRSFDLRARRQALSISIDAMARGLGMRVGDLTAIEDGKITDDKRDAYAGWLAATEYWPEQHRRREVKRAEDGYRFTPSR